MRLLITRPDDDAERTLRALEKLGHHGVISPALQIRYLVDAKITVSRPQAILVTSVNAVRALERHGRAKALMECPVLAVGDHTALEAKRAGFANARSAQGDVDDLYALVVRDCTPGGGTLLYAAGADQSCDLAGRLGDAGFSSETVIVYRAEPATGLTADAQDALRSGEIDGILFYSARSARSFGHQLKQAGLPAVSDTVTSYCLSQTIADEVQAFAAGPVLVAATPDQLALFALLEP